MDRKPSLSGVGADGMFTNRFPRLGNVSLIFCGVPDVLSATRKQDGHSSLPIRQPIEWAKGSNLPKKPNIFLIIWLQSAQAVLFCEPHRWETGQSVSSPLDFPALVV